MKKVISVTALDNYMLKLEFNTKEIRLFDVRPYIDLGIFTQLKNERYFKDVRTSFDSICWKDGQDFSPDTLYIKSVPVD